MQFEFQESDVMFGEADRRSSYEDDGYSCQDVLVPFRQDLRACGSSNKRGKNKKRSESGSNSPPVDIPHNVRRFRDFEEHFDDGVDGDEGDMVPPHVIVDRRWTDGRVACSVCFSHGRTLKGRYLSEVRNSILRMTGFLES